MTRTPTGATRGDVDARQDADSGQISHAIARVARAHRVTAGQLLRRMGLYAGQELLMMRLWETGPQGQSGLIKELDLDASTVTRMVQRLEQNGFVTRCPDPKDRRAVLVATTEAGEALRPEVGKMWQELEERTLAGVDEEDRDHLARLLAAIERNLTV
ncbi:winged helix-turn-helix transcriptional regulator [Streptomyces sp. SID10853]|uniref:MarR family winged helix-turn-helix transcriptional regulator n=1 Tax=Streptomyces sp. SID10853 TaxID=2706028 RepID=UPI0013C0FE7A|nr:MarR family winged helix-turn-helix transcriptional regulator [Streptomyces sp. SID10853]NDZ82766.1 winged helix-turn-helix transcriptional regulator [Streptomyces sp. SID10853]